MRTRFVRIAPLLLALAAACARTTTSADPAITARAEGGDVVVRNHTSLPVYYMAADEEALAVMLWAPCTDPQTCDSIPAGGSVRIPRAEITGVRAETRIVSVLAWHLAPQGAGHAVVMLQPARVEI